MGWLTQQFELRRGGDRHNVRPMEGLRGFAVFLVFLVHYVTLVEPWVAASPHLAVVISALHGIGTTGVDLFFVLSGYLIYGSLISRPQRFVRFMTRRIARIYPAFIVVLAVYVALAFAFPSENKIPTPATAGLIYLLQNFLLLPGLFAIEPLITVAWSLSYEMFFYLCIPLVITVFRLRDRSRIWRTCFFLAVAAITATYCAAFGGPIRLIMFVSGIVLHEAINSRRPSPSSLFGLAALALGLLATLVPMAGYGGLTLKISALFVSFFVLCFACFRDSSGWLPRAFSWTPLRWLGNMRYSYFLLHGLALKAAFLTLATILPVANHRAWFFWMLLPVMFSFTLIPSAALFTSVERPFSLSPRRTAQ